MGAVHDSPSLSIACEQRQGFLHARGSGPVDTVTIALAPWLVSR